MEQSHHCAAQMAGGAGRGLGVVLGILITAAHIHQDGAVVVGVCRVRMVFSALHPSPSHTHSRLHLCHSVEGKQEAEQK